MKIWIERLKNILVRRRSPTLLDRILTIFLILTNIGLIITMSPMVKSFIKMDKETIGNPNYVNILEAYYDYDGWDYDYDAENYNCKNFTQYFLNYADKKGFHCESVNGCTNDGNESCHRWVRCDIEPQSFEFVDYNKYYARQWKSLGGFI